VSYRYLCSLEESGLKKVKESNQVKSLTQCKHLCSGWLSKVRLNGALSNLIELKMSLLITGVVGLDDL